MVIGILLILMVIVIFFLVLVNFTAYLVTGRVITNKNLWGFIQVWTLVILPVIFLGIMDLTYKNDCCTDSAIFSPQHRIGIYTLIILYSAAYIKSIFRKNILPPVTELFLNALLLAGLLLNILFCKHFTTIEDGPIWWLFGNMPIIFLLLIELAENQKLLQQHINNNELTTKDRFGKFCLYILKLNPLLKYPILLLVLVPILIFLSLFLLLFGQKPDSMIRAFTDTYKHGFSQLDYMCDNVDCGGHFLCSVGANGHRSVVKPVRYGERNGNKIICNRQLLVSNAFEELTQERLPKTHLFIRRVYNKVGDLIHRHYHIFNNKIISDIVYLLMKPLELIFLLVLYTLDRKPENRIAAQYLSREDKEKIAARLK